MANSNIQSSTPEGRAEWNSDLTKLAATTTDFSSFEVDEIQPDSEENATESDNSTLTNEPADQPPQATEDRSNSTEKEATEVKSSQDETKKTPDTNNNQESVSKRPDTNQKPVPYSRFSEVTKEKNEWKAKYDELAKNQVQKPAGEQKQDHAIPPPYDKKPEPYKSNFTEEQLEGVIASGEDESIKDVARAELNKMRDSERKVTRWEAWEARNQQAYEKRQALEHHYNSETLKKWPGLDQADSPELKEYTRLLGVVNKIDANFMKNPEARYRLGEIMDWKLKSVRVDTVLQENQKLKDEIQTLRKARQPLVANGKQEVGEPSEDLKPATTNGFAEKIRLAGVNRR